MSSISDACNFLCALLIGTYRLPNRADPHCYLSPVVTAKTQRMVELVGSAHDLHLNKERARKVAQSKASLLILRVEQYYVHMVQEASQRQQRCA